MNVTCSFTEQASYTAPGLTLLSFIELSFLTDIYLPSENIPHHST